MRTVNVKCPYCNGNGKTKLSGKYADTLRLLAKHPGSTGADLAKLDGCKATTMNNRLSRLEWHGLAKSKRYGRQRLYTAKEK